MCICSVVCVLVPFSKLANAESYGSVSQPASACPCMGFTVLGTPTTFSYGGQKSIAKRGFGGMATFSAVSPSYATSVPVLSHGVGRISRPISRSLVCVGRSRITGGCGSLAASREVAPVGRWFTRVPCSRENAAYCPSYGVCFRQRAGCLRQTTKPLAVISSTDRLSCPFGTVGRSFRLGSRISPCRTGCVSAPHLAGYVAISPCRLSRMGASCVFCLSVGRVVCAAISLGCISPFAGI